MYRNDADRMREKLDQIRALADSRVTGKDRAAFLAFMEQVFANAPVDDVTEPDAEELYGATLSLWRLGERRDPDEPRVRFYNPRIEEHGWESGHSVLEIVNDDMPFLVDSVTHHLTDRSLGIHAILHPIVSVRRDAQGRRLDAGETGGSTLSESVMQIQVDQVGDPARLAEIETSIRTVLADVRVAVRDWPDMTARLRDAARDLKSAKPKGVDRATVAECVAFLDWLADNHFTILGWRDYSLGGKGKPVTPVEGSGLGLMRDPGYNILRDADGNFVDWAPEADAFIADTSPLLILKANRRSTVHRTTHLDYIGIKVYGADGKVTGERRLIGLFTAAVYNRSPFSIPLLRRKIANVIANAGLNPDSHDGKALANVLENFPRDELFQVPEDLLLETALGALHLETRPRTKVFVRPDRFGRFMSALVFFPRERFNTDLRIHVGNLLAEAYDGRVSSYYPAFGDGPLARVHYIIATRPGAVPEVDVAELNERVRAATRLWTDDLHDVLVERLGEDAGNRLHDRYGRGFPAHYREDYPAAVAIADIETMEHLDGPGDVGLKFYRRLEDGAATVRLKLYHLGAPLPLSDCLPILENMGLRVMEERPYEVSRSDGCVYIHDFSMLPAEGQEIDLAALREKLEATFASVWAGRLDDDRFNRLVVRAGIDPADINVLRAYAKFLRQTNIPFSQAYMEDALAAHPVVARTLVALFHARFDPRLDADLDARKAQSGRLADEIEAQLETVSSLDEDRIIRRFRNAIMSTLRTNAWQTGPDGRTRPYLSLKFDSGQLDDLPLPRPWREIFVYSCAVEGVHLRGGPVARGGLRWSDRKEDYRTEILGLVKAQIVKNAVIVPVGAKGGFLPKALPAGGSREETVAAAIEAYKTFISALLDITDNLRGEEVVPPEDVVRFDEDDPYLVVAADKGTATFSDIANGVAREYGFWLDDAFASGGSQGYDHKKMGITARGAWEAVKRHFREMGHDTQSEPFTAAGVGDMSGDVFGNGMLLSDKIRLVAAFDHRDIFIDPDPDPATSFAERKRLFDLPRSSWADYDSSLISKGGGVYSRGLKSVPLSPEARALLGISAEKPAPQDVMQAILRADVDLMWFGGIGTYIKARSESHSDVGDRANDPVRVNAEDVRAKVIGEGANLGVTQRGRIAFALRGGRLNTDAVDNSAGVDCSDHEVNIKIAIGRVAEAGDITEKQRNALLADMTGEVADLVLATNYDQTLAISMAEARAPRRLDVHVRFMRTLEREGRLDREVEMLPNEEALTERANAGRGLTRPEIAVLMAYAKIQLFDELCASDAPDDDAMVPFLIGYMPTPLRETYREAVLNHRLRREIIATVLGNAIVNEGGITFVHRLKEEAGATMGEIARAFVVARDVFELPKLAGEVNALDTRAEASAQIRAHLALADCLTIQTLWQLQHGRTRESVADATAFFKPDVAAIAESLPEMLSDFARGALSERVGPLLAGGLPEELARRICGLEFLGGACDVVRVARGLDRDVSDVAATYFAAGARLGLDWLRAAGRDIEASDHWERIALGRLVADVRAHQSALAARSLEAAKGKAGVEAVEAWASANPEVVDRAERLVEELRTAGGLTLAKIAVAASQLRTLIAS
ncbi:MAG: NAD-glutamate dehydrogenase [Alphaproteobacteria bacterium]|nr:NAD-glutamate dehydrogenase [Alphaproteobacteria bacterium]MDX5369024.1 NAD-glutamate dehydrogenase [Alphaproteobacteria bacterium]MDX5463727.1 NAD-glutamate dehydrogenase [Alphaproteobacteria bacterium]